MRNVSLASIALAAGLSFAGVAHAGVVYDNGSPNGDVGYPPTSWVIAEDFSFSTDVVVTGAGIYFSGLDEWDGTVTYGIFSNNSGMPGSVLASGSGQNISTSNTGTPSCCGDNIYLLSFDLSSDFAAVAGSTYWLGLHLSDDFDYKAVYWSSTDANGTEKARLNEWGGLETWQYTTWDLAFYLTSSEVTEHPVATPAPAGMALLGFGLVALGSMRRRKN